MHNYDVSRNRSSTGPMYGVSCSSGHFEQQWHLLIGHTCEYYRNLVLFRTLFTVLSRCYAPFVVTPPPPLFSAKLLLRVTFCSLIRPPTYTCTHVFGLLLPQCLL